MIVFWAISAAIVSLAAVALGVAIKRGMAGILIDTRGRYSLTQLQIVVWTIVVLSLISGVFWGRLFGGLAADALAFTIPEELLIVLGVSVGSTVASTVIKADHDATNPSFVAASNRADPPRFTQVFMVEEGPMADKVVDIAKFQNFWITLLLIVAYVALAIAAIGSAATPSALNALPGFSDNLVVLLAISHAGYLAGKLPKATSQAPGQRLDWIQVYGPEAGLPDLATARNPGR